jgi:hypothetical protein
MQLIHKLERSRREIRYPEICLKAYPPASESNKVLDSYMTTWNINIRRHTLRLTYIYIYVCVCVYIYKLSFWLGGV